MKYLEQRTVERKYFKINVIFIIFDDEYES
jgi:hypothetical protein